MAQASRDYNWCGRAAAAKGLILILLVNELFADVVLLRLNVIFIIANLVLLSYK